MIKNIKKTGNNLADSVIGAAATIANMEYPSISTILRSDLREIEADAIDQLVDSVRKFHEQPPEMRLVR